MFSLQSIEERLSEKKTLSQELSTHISFLRSIDLAITNQFGEEEALMILASKFTFSGVLLLKAAIQHVPKTYSMKLSEFGGVSLRSLLIHEMISAARITPLSSLECDQVEFHVNFMESNCAKFLSSKGSLDESQLWEMCEGERYRFTKFLAPPVSSCLSCEGNLSMHNRPSKAKVFTLEGPIPASKITLECRNCKISYGIARYTRDGKSNFYPRMLSGDIIGVSNTTYMSERLYKWIPSLRYASSYRDMYSEPLNYQFKDF